MTRLIWELCWIYLGLTPYNSFGELCFCLAPIMSLFSFCNQCLVYAIEFWHLKRFEVNSLCDNEVILDPSSDEGYFFLQASYFFLKNWLERNKRTFFCISLLWEIITLLLILMSLIEFLFLNIFLLRPLSWLPTFLKSWCSSSSVGVCVCVSNNFVWHVNYSIASPTWFYFSWEHSCFCFTSRHTMHFQTYMQKDLVIYEMNVRAFTADESSGLASSTRGSYLGVIDKVELLVLQHSAGINFSFLSLCVVGHQKF